jgi:hypothetical protein
MGWPQPKSPIQTDNSTASGVVNNTIVPCQSKMMDMRFWWLRAMHPRISFATTGMLAPKTGRITTPNITQIPTMNPIGQHTQAFGIGLAHECYPPPNHWPLGFPSRVFPILFFALFTFSSILFSHILDVAARV